MTNVNYCDDYGNTELMRAAVMLPEETSLEETQYLINHGADVNASNNAGNTAIMLAVMSGNFKTARLLGEYGADRFQCNNEGKNAEDMLQEQIKRLETVGAVLDQLQEA